MSRHNHHRIHRLEKFHEPMPSQSQFLVRLMWFFTAACLGLLLWLLFGAVLFHGLYGDGWMTAFYNAAMLLVGQGPPIPPPSSLGKLAVSAYAVISAMVVITSGGVILYPAWHRIQHHAHLDE